MSTRSTRARLGPARTDLVIVSRALATFGEELKSSQTSQGRGRVIVDRRADEPPGTGRVEHERRRPPSPAAVAAMRVLGFAVVPSGRPAPGAGAARPPRPSRPKRPARR